MHYRDRAEAVGLHIFFCAWTKGAEGRGESQKVPPVFKVLALLEQQSP